jgi:hypothetical protein
LACDREPPRDRRRLARRGDVRGPRRAPHAAHPRALNALAPPGSGTLPRRFVVETDGFHATADATYEDDRRRQLLVRRREWVVAGEGRVEDFVRFRTLAPQEIEHPLAPHGFETLAMYANRELVETDLSGSSLTVVAQLA